VCCHVNFDPNICPQCQVAGCACKGKNEKCRLSTLQIGAAKLSPFQLRARIIELEKQVVELMEQKQHLTRQYFETQNPSGWGVTPKPDPLVSTSQVRA
jgi:hypothetical protein